MDRENSKAPPFPDDFRRTAAPIVLTETVTLDLDIDSLAWLRQSYPNWQDVLNTLLCHFHDRSLVIEAGFDPDRFEPGELIADEPPMLEFL